MIEYFIYEKDLNENPAWLTQKTEEPKCNKVVFTPPHTHTHTQSKCN